MKILKTELDGWVDFGYACYRESKNGWKDPFYGYAEMNRELHNIIFGGSLISLGEMFFQQYQLEDVLRLSNEEVKKLMDRFLTTINNLEIFL